jgi:pyruvate ferredoxin oxidoreductase gamma subunit
MLEIRWHGRGGQGAITVSRVLAMAALKQDFFVQSFPEYGPERGGAPMKAFNRIDSREITLHCGVYEPEIVVVLDRTLLSVENVCDGLKATGTLIVNTSESPKVVRQSLGFSGEIGTVDADFIARQTNKFPNVAMLGALMHAIPTIELERVIESLREFLSEKLSESAIQINIEALRRGYEQVQFISRSTRKPKTALLSSLATKARLKNYSELLIGAVITPENREENQTGGWRQEKPVFDEALCVNCSLCWINCPEPAILTEHQKMLGYDYRYCKGCAICYASCPVGAISMVPEATEVPPYGKLQKASSDFAATKGERSDES